MRVGKPGVRQRVFWIECDGPLEVLDALPDVRFRPLLPEEASLQAKLVRVGVTP
jgi:hypothetical protein